MSKALHLLKAVSVYSTFVWWSTLGFADWCRYPFQREEDRRAGHRTDRDSQQNSDLDRYPMVSRSNQEKQPRSAEGEVR